MDKTFAARPKLIYNPSMEVAQESFRKFVQEEYDRRLERNSNYSLRTFARNLQVDPSLLSKLLRGKRPFTKGMIDQIGSKVGLNEVELLSFKNSILKDEKWSLLSEMEEDTLQHWSCLAILELLKTDDSKSNVSWIAKRLSVSEEIILSGLNKLQKNKIIEIKDSGIISMCKENTTTSRPKHSSIVKKRLQQQYLDLCSKAIEEVPFEKRENAGLTVAIDPSLIPEVKAKIKIFCREIDELAGKSENKSEVYQLSVGMFPLTGEA